MSKKYPIAVLISDIHFSIPTLELATKSLDMALEKADDLGVPCIVAGDMHDTKANIRGECINAIRDCFKAAHGVAYVIVGNHDKINEKSDEHSLRFLEDLVMLVTEPRVDNYDGIDVVLVPYYHEPKWLKEDLAKIPKDTIIIMHQGLNGSLSGEYVQDKSALTPNDVAGRRIISGHYHARQDIKLPDDGLWSYIGNPFTLNFAEAKDPEKGFRVLYNDGSLEFVPTNLRKHLVYEIEAGKKANDQPVIVKYPGDLLWLKVFGTKEQLLKFNKKSIPDGARIDLIPTSPETENVLRSSTLTDSERLDKIIDETANTDETKARLKELWRKASCS